MRLSKSKQLVGVRSDARVTIEYLAEREGTHGRFSYAKEMGFASSERGRVCKLCGGPVARGQPRATCRKCYFAARKVTLRLRCARCSVEFDKPRYEYEKSCRNGRKSFYCSLKCALGKGTTKVVHPCLTCMKPIRDWSKKRKYCSRTCRPPSGKRIYGDRSCPSCGVFFRPMSGKQQYCTRDCANAAHSKRMAGSGNSRFSPASEWSGLLERMKPLILERDGHKCVACGHVGKKAPVRHVKAPLRYTLHVHHIDINPRNNAPENLVSLCKGCHKRHHEAKEMLYPWLGSYAAEACRSMTFKLKERITSLQTAFSSTTASLLTIPSEV